jgi:hypothetical protein
MTTSTTTQAVTELNERLLVLTRSQARLTWALRGLRTHQATQVDAPATTDPTSSQAATRPNGVPPTAPPLEAPRNMLRVSPVARPHRATKRNYDYFDRLHAELANLPRNGNGNGTSNGHGSTPH